MWVNTYALAQTVAVLSHRLLLVHERVRPTPWAAMTALWCAKLVMCLGSGLSRGDACCWWKSWAVWALQAIDWGLTALSDWWGLDEKKWSQVFPCIIWKRGAQEIPGGLYGANITTTVTRKCQVCVVFVAETIWGLQGYLQSSQSQTSSVVSLGFPTAL